MCGNLYDDFVHTDKEVTCMHFYNISHFLYKKGRNQKDHDTLYKVLYQQHKYNVFILPTETLAGSQ